MAEISKPKGSPSIDMTPMVDLAFLLVTFFMLAANFRTDEPVDISIPSSIGDKEIPPKTAVLVSVDKGGRVYFDVKGGEEVRTKILGDMAKKYQVQLSNEEVKEFSYMSGSFGCSMGELKQYLALDGEGRKKYRKEDSAFGGIPSDSTHNELKDWIYFSKNRMLDYGKDQFEKESGNKGPNGEPLKPEDFKPKFILKADMEAEYVRTKQAIETFRDLNINNLNFVTSQEAAPVR
ncbi:MAG: ExbD/TolR family protein [Fluviicola sp.]